MDPLEGCIPQEDLIPGFSMSAHQGGRDIPARKLPFLNRSLEAGKLGLKELGEDDGV
jgi:hypothetical protein